MRRFYFDASALAKRYVAESGAHLVDHLFACVTPDRLHVLNVGFGEVASVLVRKRNAGQISSAVLSQAMVNLGVEVIQSPTFHKVTADDALVAAALPLIESHSLNATDAIVLRSALNLEKILQASGSSVVILASDQRLLRAAQAEGLVTFDPESQDQVALDALLAP